jgi:hypothetical protein
MAAGGGVAAAAAAGTAAAAAAAAAAERARGVVDRALSAVLLLLFSACLRFLPLRIRGHRI